MFLNPAFSMDLLERLYLPDVYPLDSYVCVPCAQASMMSAENDPLGPLPPGWGKFILFFPKSSACFHWCLCWTVIMGTGSSSGVVDKERSCTKMFREGTT